MCRADTTARATGERKQGAENHQYTHTDGITNVLVLNTVVDHVCHDERNQNFHDCFTQHNDRGCNRVLPVFTDTGGQFLDHTIPSFLSNQLMYEKICGRLISPAYFSAQPLTDG